MQNHCEIRVLIIGFSPLFELKLATQCVSYVRSGFLTLLCFSFVFKAVNTKHLNGGFATQRES